MDEFAQRWASKLCSASDPPQVRSEAPVAASPKGRSWLPPVERMPPAIQFGLRLANWFRTKCAPAEKEKAPLRMVGQLSLGGKRHLALVEVGDLRFLVGGGAENVTVIVPVAANANSQKAVELNAIPAPAITGCGADDGGYL